MLAWVACKDYAQYSRRHNLHIQGPSLKLFFMTYGREWSHLPRKKTSHFFCTYKGFIFPQGSESKATVSFSPPSEIWAKVKRRSFLSPRLLLLFGGQEDVALPSLPVTAESFLFSLPGFNIDEDLMAEGKRKKWLKSAIGRAMKWKSPRSRCGIEKWNAPRANKLHWNILWCKFPPRIWVARDNWILACSKWTGQISRISRKEKVVFAFYSL